MDILLLIVYSCILIVHIILLVSAVKRHEKRRWIIVYAGELASLLSAALLSIYYDKLPGMEPMPGLTYFAEYFYSFFAAAAYTAILVIFVVAGIIVRVRSRITS